MIDPIRRSITVRLTPAEAFRLFTSEMGSWWPLDSHGRADEETGEKTERLVFEEREGGRIYEVFSSGAAADWAVVTTWAPPERLVLDWNPSSEDRPCTEVEVTFTPAGEGATRVDLVHRGWERLGEEAGRRFRANYDTGWAYVFDERFAAGTPTARPSRSTTG
jgi:uncharacterized protein YndB with AHSA1/START domain